MCFVGKLRLIFRERYKVQADYAVFRLKFRLWVKVEVWLTVIRFAQTVIRFALRFRVGVHYKVWLGCALNLCWTTDMVEVDPRP
jgi:hypothetical protein